MEITHVTDEDLGLRELCAAERLRDHREMDCEYGGEIPCASCDADRDTLAAIKVEQDRREAEGIRIADMTFEERYAPFGPAWADEQAERAFG